VFRIVKGICEITSSRAVLYRMLSLESTQLFMYLRGRGASPTPHPDEQSEEVLRQAQDTSRPNYPERSRGRSLEILRHYVPQDEPLEYKDSMGLKKRQNMLEMDDVTK